MNNTEYPSRVVINLDDKFDAVDDDDITLPSFPTQSETLAEDFVTAQELASKGVADSSQELSASDKAVNATEVGNIALGAPLITPEIEDSKNKVEDIAISDHDVEQTATIAAVPLMPLQEQLSDANVLLGNNESTSDISQDESAKLADQIIDKEPTGRQKGSWFNRMKSGLSKSRKNLAEGMVSILIGGKEIDDELLEEVEDQLLVADIGVRDRKSVV